MDTLTSLKGAATLLEGGVTPNAYKNDNGYCFIGAIAEYEFGDGNRYTQQARWGNAYDYVLKAIDSLLPNWDTAVFSRQRNQLAENVLVRACNEGAGVEIAGIVMRRAIKLCEADIAIADGKLADEAEMISQGGERSEVPDLHLEIRVPDANEILRSL